MQILKGILLLVSTRQAKNTWDLVLIFHNLLNTKNNRFYKCIRIPQQPIQGLMILTNTRNIEKEI